MRTTGPPTKACPVVIRRGPSGEEILVFRHPVAGVQLVKGTIESGERACDAAARELAEESGISGAMVGRSLGVWPSDYEGQVWEFFDVQTMSPLSAGWRHFTDDGGGLELDFFWHPLSEEPTADWHPLFVRALEFIVTYRGREQPAVASPQN